MHHITLLVSLAAGLFQLTADVSPSLPLTPFPQNVQGEFSPQEERYQVILLTTDQGGNIWELFGHNAILIRDRWTGQDLAWNWGLFNFEDSDFLLRFLKGTMLYSMGPAPLEPFLEVYRAANRTVYANEIFLTQAEAGRLNELVRQNFEPENRDYVYHYFLDNCSTRVRDVLDTVLGGPLRERFSAAVTPMSLRWHTRRLVQETPWIDQGLSFLLGIQGDPPRTEWEAMFIPMEMMELLEGFERPDGAGGTRPLLGPRQVLVQADRRPTPETPPSFSLLWLVLGIGSAILFLSLGNVARQGGLLARAGLAGSVTLWGVFSGLLGSLLVASWFTDHDFIQWNANIFQLSPLALLLAAIISVALTRKAWWYGRPGRLATTFALLIAGLSVLAGLLQLMTIMRQGNAEALAVGIPVNLAIAVALVRATGWSWALSALVRSHPR